MNKVSLFALFIIAFSVFACNQEPQTTVFYNANGYTLTSNVLESFSVMAVQGDEIVYVGDDKSAVENAGKEIDLEGKTVLPGLIDAHGHIMGLGYNRLDVDLAGIASKKETLEKLAEYAEANPESEWIRGRGWNHTRWDDTNDFPTASDLDAVLNDKPVWLSRVDGHAVWVNSKAMNMAGISKETVAPQGGKIIKDGNGEPTGILVDKAMNLVGKYLPQRTDEDRRKALELALEEMRRMGLTSVHDARIDIDTFELFKEFAREGKLTTRIHAMIGGTGKVFDKISANGPMKWNADNTLSVMSVKLYEDGALGSRGAAMIEPYHDEPSHSGLLFYEEDTLFAQAKKAADKGYQVNIHAIGDQANRTVLDVFERLREEEEPGQDLRHRIEHAQVVALEDIPRFSENNIIASMQPTHATSDMNMAEDRVGPDRIKGAYAWNRFKEAGVLIAGGSDFPVEYSNPFFGLYSAVTRKDHQGQPPGGWYSDQALSRAGALALFTQNAAYSGYQEATVGRLEEGYKADFIVIDRDYFTIPDGDIFGTQVEQTWMNGEKVYQRD